LALSVLDLDRAAMSDIFISYKREEQAIARNLANAFETQGWTVWWDPKLRAGERFNDVIEKALKESKCVVVMWSKRSVESEYVRDEAIYALNRSKLVPVMIEEVELPFRFEGLHTRSLLAWDGSKAFPEFRRLVDDISTILRRQRFEEEKNQQEVKQRCLEVEAQHKAEEDRLRRRERQHVDECFRPKSEEPNRRLMGALPAVSSLGLRTGQIMCGLAIALLFNTGSIFDLENNQPWWFGLFALFVIVLLGVGAILWTQNRAAVSDLDLERATGQIMCVLTVAVFGIVVVVFDLGNTKPWWEKYFQGLVLSLLAFGALLWTMSRKKVPN
jgi:TIR domain